MGLGDGWQRGGHVSFNIHHAHVRAQNRANALVALLPLVEHLLVRSEKVHGKVNAGQLPAGHGQVAWRGRPAAQDDRVALRTQGLQRQLWPIGRADLCVGHKGHALLLELAHAALDRPLLQLHVGNAVHEEPAHAVLTLVHGHRVACAVELVGGGETSRAGGRG